ncbi:MAG TPA: hypothetical protein VF797_01530 [Noviherbaspirillum sp.]
MTTTNNAIDPHAGFEAWALANGFKIERRDDPESADTYFRYETEQRWIVWQAARQAAPVAPTEERFYMDHGVWHDRATGQHLWMQDQYDEQWRAMYKAGQEDAANGFNMLTGKAITPATHQATLAAPADDFAVRFIEQRAQQYLQDHADNDPETGALVFQYGEAGREYHSTLVELADDIRTALAEADGSTTCDVPPPGWSCTRAAGHSGPCAAIPASPPEPAASQQADAPDPEGDFAKGMLIQLSRMGASPAALSLAVQLFGVGPCDKCGFRKLHCRCTPAVTTASASTDNAELVELLKAIRPSFGAVGSRDVDVAAQQKRIDRAVELLGRAPAPSREAAPLDEKTVQSMWAEAGLEWKDGGPSQSLIFAEKVAALARAPLPVQGDAATVVATEHGVDLHVYGVAVKSWVGAEKWNAFANDLAASINAARRCRAQRTDKPDSNIGAAHAEEVRDAARYRFIEQHATMYGGGNGFTIQCFVGADEEDMGVGIDKMIAASKTDEKGNQ